MIVVKMSSLIFLHSKVTCFGGSGGALGVAPALFGRADFWVILGAMPI